jgi:hypothetical protein
LPLTCYSLKFMKFLIVQLSPVFSDFLRHKSNYPHSVLFSSTHSEHVLSLTLPSTNFIYIIFVPQNPLRNRLISLQNRTWRPNGGSRDIAVLFLSLGVRMGWMVNATPRRIYPRQRDPVPIVEETGWAPEPFCRSLENFAATGIRYPGRPAHSDSAIPTELYWPTKFPSYRLTNTAFPLQRPVG